MLEFVRLQSTEPKEAYMSNNPHYDEDGNLTLDYESDPVGFTPPEYLSETSAGLTWLLLEDIKVPVTIDGDDEFAFILEIGIPGLQLGGAGHTFEDAVEDLQRVINSRLQQASLVPNLRKGHLEIILKLQMGIEKDELAQVLFEALLEQDISQRAEDESSEA